MLHTTHLFTIISLLFFLSGCTHSPSSVTLAGVDDGVQMESPFRLGYAGYLPLQDKLLVYIAKIENVVTGTHNALVSDLQSGKLVVGPNNWTNSNDDQMPGFGTSRV